VPEKGTKECAMTDEKEDNENKTILKKKLEANKEVCFRIITYSKVFLPIHAWN
jgi:hypothetical protein